MRAYLPSRKSSSGFTLIELLVSMVITTLIGGAIFVTFSQGVRIWQASVRESSKGQEEFFFEGFRSELRNAFVYGKTALNGQSQVIEFYALQPDLRGKGKNLKVWKVPAQIRYRFDVSQKAIQKETTFYEKILYPKNDRYEKKRVLENVSDFNLEYYKPPQKEGAATWVRQWRETCFPEAIKLTVSFLSSPNSQESRVISFPALGECGESEDEAV